MTKPTLFLAISLCARICYGQRTDTLIFNYNPDQFRISKPDRQKLDSFLMRGWDRISITGYTDETDEESYNLELSKRRSTEVFDYLMQRSIPRNRVSYQFFGEAMPRADNNSDEGRALNRRTEIIGFQFARLKTKLPNVDLMKPVTKTLDNGFIITYRPGSLSESMAANLESGSGINFTIVRNTSEMRQNNLFNNTTNGEILSSVMIFCGRGLDPCKLDSPVLLRVPVPISSNCPIEKVKFFNAVAENGKRIWQEQSKQLYPEKIDGITYIRLWIDNFCDCINFDFKIDPDCFDTDSTKLLFVNTRLKNFTVELRGLNSVYFPRKINDTTYSLVYLRNKLDNAPISFSLYSSKKRIRGFKDHQVSSLPYDSIKKGYELSIDTVKLYFPKINIGDVSIKVNKDKYRVVPEKNRYEFLYLKGREEEILVDFSIIGPKGRVTTYKNQPLESFPYDEAKGYHVINKDHIKFLNRIQSVTVMR